MTREDVEQAAQEFIYPRSGWLDLTDFAIQQINAALEEALTALRNLKRPFMVPSIRAIEIAEDAIRALKIPEEP